MIVDFKEFTITSDVGTDYHPCVYISAGTGIYPTTVRNGTITTFEEGVSVNSVSNITVNNIVFNQNQIGVSLEFVDSSTVSNCSFNGDVYGAIQDDQSAGGNSYNNNTFGVGGGVALSVQSQSQGYGGTPLVLDRCDFAAPPAP